MKRSVSLLFILVFTCSASLLSAQKNEARISNKSKAQLVEYINQLKSDPLLKNASWSIRVVNPTNDDVVATYNENASLLPASTMKIVTTGVGLVLLGSDYTFSTLLQIDGHVSADSVLYGNIHIVGGGDPSLGSSIHSNTLPDSIFTRWVLALKSAGINRVSGSIIADEGTIFDNEYRNESWNWGDIGLGYGAGTSGIQFSDNLYKLRIKPNTSIGDTAIIESIHPHMPDLSFENHTTTVGADGRTSISILSSPYSPRVLVVGTVSNQRSQTSVDAAIPNPSYVCAWHFSSFLNANGIATSGKVEVYNSNSTYTTERKTIDTYYSPTLAELVSETNKSSNNCYAESILKIIGYQIAGNGSTAAGTKIVESTLKAMNIPLQGFKQEDGSGLSRKNLITTTFMCSYLAAMPQQPCFDTFEKSLSCAGTDGTLKSMLKGTAGENKVKAKSGSMGAVRCYAGYVTTKSNHQLCFAIMMNNFTCTTSEISKRMERLMQLIAEIS